MRLYVPVLALGFRCGQANPAGAFGFIELQTLMGSAKTTEPVWPYWRGATVTDLRPATFASFLVVMAYSPSTRRCSSAMSVRISWSRWDFFGPSSAKNFSTKYMTGVVSPDFSI